MNIKQASGIQIIGTQRSGSNLLRVILDQSPDIASPHPPHILTTFVPLLPLYGSLNAQSYRNLISNVVDFVNANPVPWEGVLLDKDTLFTQSETFSLFELNKLIYLQAAIIKNAKYWCCKSMGNVYYAEDLEKVEPNLKYIYLYRDGRDVAASFKKAIVGEKHIYFLAKQWHEDQEACLTLMENIEKDNLFALNYETLITDPEDTVKQLCDFLEISYTNEMLQFYTSNTSKITAAAGAMWSNLEKPIMSNNTKKFINEFNDTDLQIFELVAGETLERLGYPLLTKRQNNELISTHAIEQYDQENKVMKKDILLKTDRKDLEKREPQSIILKMLKEKLNTYDITS
ncbi:sulfotransferase family protein [Pseudopedobacter beijingensis]|uniref:Sulfotransferase family protein n=1 Tax=Pseudopedobacter beijingensis TaxID=1207056 RepID=A0ABW4IAY8_9SPHI